MFGYTLKEVAILFCNRDNNAFLSIKIGTN